MVMKLLFPTITLYFLCNKFFSKEFTTGGPERGNFLLSVLLYNCIYAIFNLINGKLLQNTHNHTTFMSACVCVFEVVSYAG